ncbi:DoxX family protein [Candidatus Nitrosotenuis chungbukensis]|uniref:DoxX family protein n=1 Tax=Candidatus Nitrosotenuis chungbukensis TaxID=1353246 RepID=UPI002671CC53|nr:DoxX family protein [Candidatus Nitrosotenuis chungbukensis]WKT58168.1 DoxX family protein [Candidatus Nitrosotenuis chungbukensis]
MSTSLSENVAKTSRLHEITYWGIRSSVGVIFIAYGLQKFDPVWRDLLVGFGLPPELQIPIALAETIGGMALIVGVLTRITGAIFSIILVDAIFHIRWEKGFFIAKGGWDYDLALLAMVLFIIVAGSGSLSISSRLKRIPNFLQ